MRAPSDPPRRRVALPCGPAAYTDEEADGDDAAPVVVMVHGLPGSGRDFRWLAPHVATTARVIRVDLPGFGETPATTGTGHTPREQAQYLLDVLDALQIVRCLLVGHSMGGVYAAEVASLAPERVAGLALVSTPGLRPHRFLRRTPVPTFSALLARPLTERLLRRPLRWGFRAAGFGSRHADDELARTLHMVARVDLAAHAHRVRHLRIPTAVFWCADDPMVEDAIGSELAGAAPGGPRHRYADGGHNPQKPHAVDLAARLCAFAHELGLGPDGAAAGGQSVGSSTRGEAGDKTQR